MVSFEGLNNSDGLHKQNKQIKENHSIHDLLLRTCSKIRVIPCLSMTA